MRQALAAFPIPAMALRVMKQYYIHGGKAADAAFRAVPRFTVTPPVALQELTVVGAFCEVWLAKQEHTGPVGINFLRKIEIPLPFGLLGAMLAGVDYVLIGAGQPGGDPRRDPRAVPGRGRRVRRARPGPALRRRPGRPCAAARPSSSATPVATCPCPGSWPSSRPLDLAAGLAGDPATRPFGFIVEGPSAGGHNAPAARPATGRRARPAGLRRARHRRPRRRSPRSACRSGWPARTAPPRAWPRPGPPAPRASRSAPPSPTAQESGLADSLKRQVLAEVLAGTLDVRSDWRASPTGFPFRVIQLEGTVSDPEVAAARKAVCDLGALRTPYKKANGDIDYRCPAEPLADVHPQGRAGRRTPRAAVPVQRPARRGRPPPAASRRIHRAGDRDLRRRLPGGARPGLERIRRRARTPRARSWTTCAPDLPRSDPDGPQRGRTPRDRYPPVTVLGPANEVTSTAHRDPPRT